MRVFGLALALVMATCSLADAQLFRRGRCSGGSYSSSYVREGVVAVTTAEVAEPSMPDAPEAVGSADALAEVNAARAARGLRPFAKDHGLTLAAIAAAKFRAAHFLAGHSANDFAFLPAGSAATAAGCAAWERGSGWGSCCTFEPWTYAGAAAVVGSDGRRFMHLFVR